MTTTTKAARAAAWAARLGTLLLGLVVAAGALAQQPAPPVMPAPAPAPGVMPMPPTPPSAPAAVPVAPMSGPSTSGPAAAPAPAPTSADRLQVTDPYLEMRTGPGRGFPVFFVVQRNDWVEIELRHTDWYRVRADNGKVGWVDRKQLETTLTAGGARKSFRDILLDDYLARRIQLGAGYGRFKSEPFVKLWTSYRLSETFSVEATIGQVQGVFSGTDLWHVGFVAEPWSDRRLSPFLAVGLGKFKNFPNLSLVGAKTTDAKLANAQIGARFYLTERFVLRADYTLYTAFVSDQKSTEYKAWTGGISFFF